MPITCGVDIGSTTIKVVLMNGGDLVRSKVCKTGAHPSTNANRAMLELFELSGISRNDVSSIIATGYGRNYFKEADAAASEIICHALGVRHYYPTCRTVIDIGGQDAKIIAIDDRGKVKDFIMNDRCAAGTGKFLEMVSSMLDIDISMMGEAAGQNGPHCEISSICAVFAESEIVGLTQSGTPLNVLLRGVFRSVARRVISLGGRLDTHPDMVFSGGVALNKGVHSALQSEIGHTIHCCERPQITGAVGACLLGIDKIRYAKIKEA